MSKCWRYVQYLRILPGLLIVLSWLLPLPVMAAIPQPSSLELQEVLAFENVREDGDQLWLITYYIDFDSQPDEGADELFIFRLLDTDESEITSATAYAFYNDGYDLGTVAFYLGSSEAPTWESALTVEIIGNPLVDWTGSPPQTATDSISWNTGETDAMQELVSATIIYLASELEQAWSVEMVTSSEGVTVLSDTGAAYFLRVIPYLREIAPLALGQYIFYPDYPDEIVSDNDYSAGLVESIRGTILDLSPIERELNLPQGSINAIIWYGGLIAFFLLLSWKKRLKKGMMFLIWPFVIGGAFIGVPLVVTILWAFIALISSVYVIYKGSPA